MDIQASSECNRATKQDNLTKMDSSPLVTCFVMYKQGDQVHMDS